MTLCPAESDSGIVFSRVDRADATVPATIFNVIDDQYSTTIGRDDGLRIGTIEHLMAALAGCGIDNAVVKIDGPEVPIMDGSAAPFVSLIERAGTVEQDAPRKAIKVLKELTVGDNGRSATLSPAERFSVSFEIIYDHPLIARQELTFDFENGAFKSEIARARTFCLESEVSHLRSLGLARGGSLDNAVIVGDSRILNEGGLRHEDEFVRHKILDCIGDLYLAGGMILGHFRGRCSGHALNRRLLEALFADETAWCFTTVESSGCATEESPSLAASA